MKLLSVEPARYGRDDAGHASVSSTYQPAETRNAPSAAAVCAARARHDTGAASENLCLQAAALGLVAHQMGGFDPEQAKTRFNIPADYTCMAMIAVGHPASVEVLPEALREREQAPRERKPLADIVFEGGWNQSLQQA